MDLKNLSTFIQVAESGSFTRAAAQLGYSQPTVSVQIRQLEEELGIRLFDRIGNTVRLTEKGHETLAYAQRICHMCREMTLDAGQDRQLHGCIRLAMADSLCGRLPGSGLLAFRQRYPHISLRVTTAGTHELFRLLDHNEADIVCTLDSHIYDTNYVIAAEKQVGVHFVAAAGNPLAAQEDVPLETLTRQPLLLTERGMSYRRLLDETMARRSLELQPVLEMGRGDVLCDLVEQGMGLAFLPDYVTDAAVGRGSMVRLRVRGCEPELWMQLLYHRDKWVSPQMQAVLRHFSAWMTE